MPDKPVISSLVSVVIPCYNHGRYLSVAIDSVLAQTYTNFEIIVVDDGSADNTKEVAHAYNGVRYIYKQNAGLSAARNTGITESKGEYLLFLDADDWLYPDALEINLQYLQQNRASAFVSGAYINIFEDSGKTLPCTVVVEKDHYQMLLSYNYVGMVAAVLFRAWAFEKVTFDVNLKSCEDYDIYLKLARSHPVIHHTHIIAAYRRHSANMSGNRAVMVASFFVALQKQKPLLQTKKEQSLYNITYKSLYKQIFAVKEKAGEKELQPFKADSYTYNLYEVYRLLKKMKRATHMNKKKLKKAIPSFLQRTLHYTGVQKHFLPDVGKVATGDMDRLQPFCADFGYSRGGPIDRYYIENFLQKEAAVIRGRTMEIGDNYYTKLYGSNAVTQSDIFHVDASNPKATIIGDISNAPQIADNTFDCLILTQTLQFVYHFKDALRTCHRILKPGGTLLLTVPGITPIDAGEWKELWYWSFTDKVMKKLMEETFNQSSVTIETYGNVLVASAFLYGMGLTEIDKQKLDFNDKQFQVIVTIKATKK